MATFVTVGRVPQRGLASLATMSENPPISLPAALAFA